MGVKLNRSGLAEYMGVALTTVDRWVKEGCPVVQRGSRGVEWAFDSADIAKWYADRAVAATAGETSDLEEIERRTAKAKMEKAELELAQAKGAVAPIREFERAQAAAFAEIRTNVMNVPARAVLQLLGETDEIIFKQKLRAELALALEASATASLVLSDDEENQDDAS